MSDVIVPFKGSARKFSSEANSIQAETHGDMVLRALVVAIHVAHQAGFGDVVDRLGQLHLDVVRRLREVA